MQLSLNRPSNHDFLPGPKAILGVITCQALVDMFCDLFSSYILTLVLLWFQQPVQNKGDSTRSVQLCKIPINFGIYYIGLQRVQRTRKSTMSKKLEERVRMKKKSGFQGVNHFVVIDVAKIAHF